MAKPKLNLAKLSPEELLQFANNVKTAMTGNANFATPIPALPALTAAITALQTKLNEWNAAQTAALLKTTERNDLMETLRALLTQLAGYVEAASGGDEGKILSSGMSVRGTPTPIGIPAQVLNLIITPGDAEGELEVSWDVVAGARSYEIQTSPDPFTPASWVNRQPATKSKATLNSFTSGQRTWTRIRAVGAAGPGAWSDPAIKTVP